MAFESRRRGFKLEYKDPRTGEWVSQQEGDRRATQYNTEENAKQGLDADGSPFNISYDNWLDPNTGMLKDQYALKDQGIDMKSLEGLSALKGEALREGPSKWANLMLMKQQGDRAQGLNQATSAAAQALAQGRSGLAMRGGLSSGARERMAGQSMRDLLTAKQGVNQAANQAKYGILGQDEQNRLGSLSQFTTGEGQLAQFNKGNQIKQNEFNILQSLQEKQNQQQFKKDIYSEQMKKWAAGKQADATAASGGGGGK